MIDEANTHSEQGEQALESEELAVGVWVEADHPCLAPPDGGGAKVSARPQAGSDQLRLLGWVVLQVEHNDPLSLRHDHTRRVAEDLHEVTLAVALLRSIDSLTDRHVPAGEEVVGPGAARSALAVVVPVDALGHGDSSLISLVSS